MSEIQEVKEFLKKYGDPFEILGINQTTDKKEIKNAYKDMARKYHPDKNKEVGSQQVFIKIKQCYDYLTDKKKLEAYIRFQNNNHIRLQELKQSSLEQQQFAKDLIRREQVADKKKAEEDELRTMKRQEEIQRIYRENEEIQNQKKAKEQKKLQFDLENKDSYRKLNSIKVKWPKDSVYNKALLMLTFKGYGPIKEITILLEKRKSVIEFHTTEAANNSVLDNQSDLKIKSYMKAEKRTKLQQFLCTSKEKLQRDDKEVFNLSTDSLNRISHFYNKDSKVFMNSQMDMLKHEQERKKMMQKILEEELMY